MNNNSEQIGRYLQNEMNADEKIAFEKQLATNKDLQQELFIQKQIIKAVETAGLKNAFGKAVWKKMIIRRLIQFGIAAVILVVAAFIFYAVKTNIFSHGERTNIDSAEIFVINNAADTIIETDEGVVFGIPANAFGTDNKKVRLEIKTAISPEKIMTQGLSTTSNGELLQTAGMFYINGYVDEKPVSLVKKIDVSVPTKNVNPAMQLFNGVQDSSGRINWVNPKPIENNLRTYDITTLDFYPTKYIPTLKALGKDYANKKYTDSLYYSFSGYGHHEKDLIIAKTDTTNMVEGRFSNADTSGKRDELLDSVIYDKYRHYEIDPSRIKAIWDKQFNNTILATKEFEERLHFLHNMCTSKYFEAYIEGLDKPMYEIDQLCADNSEGSVRKKFLEFTARKDGRVIINDEMQEKLSAYFQNKYKAYRHAAEKTWAKYREELNRLDQIADDKRREQETRDYLREDKNFNEEFCMNLTDAYKQIGVKRTCKDTIPAKYYNVTITNTGWKNLDVYVFDATTNRQSMNYTDPVSGKTATLTYKDVNIKIEDQAQFDKVLVYLIPESLSSFQRVEQQGNVFKESLNSLLRYDAIAIGYKGAQTYFYKQVNLQPGQYTFKLSPISENELKGLLKKYSASKSKDLKTELEYQLFEQQEIKKEMQLRKDEDFRESIAATIFGCGEGWRYRIYDSLDSNTK